MLILVTGSNYLVMFLGWEGIGVVSFLLISFWYTRIQAVKSAIQALTMNRVGDMMLSVGLFAMFALFGNLDYSTVFSISPYVNETAITIVAILLFIGATAKSAQIPLHVWLPSSMEGSIIQKKFFLTYLLNTRLLCYCIRNNLIYLLFYLVIFFLIYIISIEFNSLLDLTVSFAVLNKPRSKDGKFISVSSNNIRTTPSYIKRSINR
jgi:NADH:ubiquinone oxidoreductase subunit 2 (subunit N)